MAAANAQARTGQSEEAGVSVRPLAMANTKGWNASYRLPPEPKGIEQLRGHTPRLGENREAEADGFSATASSFGGTAAAPSDAAERIATMRRALEEHEKRDPRSRAARLQNTFYSSLRLMLREMSAVSSGPARAQHVNQLWEWFSRERPAAPDGSDDGSRSGRAPSTHGAPKPGSSAEWLLTGPPSPRPVRSGAYASTFSKPGRDTSVEAEAARAGRAMGDAMGAPYAGARRSATASTAGGVARTAGGAAGAGGAGGADSGKLSPRSQGRAMAAAGALAGGGGAWARARPHSARLASEKLSREAMVAQIRAARPYTPQDVPPDLGAYKRRDLYASFARRERLTAEEAFMPGSRVVPGSERVVEHPRGSFAHYQLSADPDEARREQEMEQRWAERRRAEARDRAEEAQMAQVVERYENSRARVDTEIMRRRETQRHGSHTAIHFHAPVKSAWADERNTAVAEAMAAVRGGGGGGGGGSGGGGEGSHAVSDGSDGSESEDGREPRDRDGGGSDEPEPLRGAQTSSSRPAEPAPTLVEPSTAHPRVHLASRSGTVERPTDGGAAGISLSAFAQPEAASRARAHAARPTTAQALHRAGAMARQVFVLDLASMGPGAAASVHPSGAVTARPILAPSTRRIIQLEECHRIKRAFDKQNVPVNMAVLERGLLLPEDLPDEVCAAALPTFRSRLVDPDAREPKKKTKKGKKGKKTAKGQGKGSAAKKPKSPGRKKSPRKR